MDILYSIIIPVYNESESVIPLYNALRITMERLQCQYEIIFVNDGSSDMDEAYLGRMMDGKVSRIVSLPGHIGQTFALGRGFKEARGKFIFSIDGDMQDDPAHIPLFIDKLKQGFDVVCGYRINRKDGKDKIVLSRFGNMLQRMIFHTGLHDISCTYRLYKRECLSGLMLSRSGYHRYIPLLLLRRGYKVAEIPIEQGVRHFGLSKYKFLSKIRQITVSFFYLLSDIFIKRA